MMKYNEWKLIQESVAPSFTLGLKTRQNLGFVGDLHEFGNPHNKEEDDEDDKDSEDSDDSDFSDEDMLDGDIMGAGDDEGGPAKNFPPDDSDDMGHGDDMDSVLGGIDPDLAGLGGGDDAIPGMGGKMDNPGAGKMGPGAGGPPALGPELTAGADMGGMGGDDMAGLGGDDMGGMGDDLGMGGPEGGDMGDMGMPCPDCNPDGSGEPDPECHTCHGIGFLPDDMGGEMGDEMGGEDLGNIGHDEIGPDIKKMNYMDMMRAYQKKYMGAGTTPASPMAKAAPTMGGPKFMNKGMSPMQHHKGMHPQHVKHCGTCEGNRAGTYAETDAEFLTSLKNNAANQNNKRWDSGFREDALIQAVDAAYAPQEPAAGQSGFAPQGRVGGNIGGGGYTQQDIQHIPVLESRKYPSLDQYISARKAKKS